MLYEYILYGVNIIEKESLAKHKLRKNRVAGVFK